MSSKNTLTIKDWSGTGTGNISFEVGGFALIEKSRGGRKIYQLIVNRKPDRHSSRLGMMANLNKTNRTLSWGFLEMNLTIEIFSDQGAFVSKRVFNFFDGVGVAESRAVDKFEEEVTFISNKKGEFCIGQC